ncbi:acetyl-coenzyme-A carboxylase [Polyrhizophydium stewartii]|uniref:Acetyl-coenzyme-A carboxylase n=1 Tax=Polyrhizophydium stewartii TaxID=2732419 RepID=A0ABR4N7G8_9FUNG|nr:acetyl-coenzyme-A carboxylase [Polyrhizophydium stewartii]
MPDRPADATASALAVRDFVLRSRGHSVITKVLIANNGMAAVKAIRSIRKWAYETFGNERLIEFTAMCTPEDLHMNAEYVRMADHYVEIPGGTANNNYSNVQLIVDIAERTRVHAVWVGWGFASENPVLVDKLTQLSPPVVFIGPPASAMRSLGDKIASTIVAQSAKVPCVSWSGDGIEIDADAAVGHATVPDDLYSAATTHDVNEGLDHAKRIGFPVMIKASEGGGGKGIRLVDSEAAFSSSFVQVQREVPGSPIFIMRVVRNARHLEVQLLADAYGNAIALFGRDCSVQRRHQKIIEEAPISVAPPEILGHMEKSAVRLAKLVGYVSAGTVEYLYEPNSKKYYFLELNPRLQVEHPTTEMVSGVNIPAAQLQVAMGIPLSCIKDIRILYGLTPTGTSDIDFDFESPSSLQIQRKPSPRGHVIATRITAENPEAGFKPNSGRVLELNFRSNSNVWGYFSVNASGGVHEYADSQFGHIFSYGESRSDARKNLIVALKEISIRGDFRTTIEYLIKLLETDDYVENRFTTQWLDALIAKRVEIERPDKILTAICGAVVKAHARFTKDTAEFRSALEKGQTPPTSLLRTSYPVEFIFDNVQFRMHVAIAGPEDYVVSTNSSSVNVHGKPLADGGMLILVDGHSHLTYTKEESHLTQLILDGKTCLLEKENDPTKLRSPSPGKLVRFLVDDGHHLKSGEAFAEIEVMKMYMPLLASESGVVKFDKPAGSVLAAGDIIGTITLDDPSRVQRAAVFDGTLPALGEPRVIGEKVHQQYKHARRAINAVLDGFELSSEPTELVRRLHGVLTNKDLPFLEFTEVLSSLVGRIPGKLDVALRETLDRARASTGVFPAEELRTQIATMGDEMQADERVLFKETIRPVVAVIDTYAGGLEEHAHSVFVELLDQFLEVERIFNETRYETVLLELRDKYRSELDTAVRLARASAKSGSRGELVLALLSAIRRNSDDAKHKYMQHLEALADLKGRDTAKVSLKAREMQIYYQLPSAEERRSRVLTHLRNAIKPRRPEAPVAETQFDYSALSQLIMAQHSILDVLPTFFYHEDEAVRATALYTYVLHTYQAYSITSVKQHLGSSPTVFTWEFVLRQMHGSSGGGGGALSAAALSRVSSLGSFRDLRSLNFAADVSTPRRGTICAFESLADLRAQMPRVLATHGILEAADNRGVSDVWNVAIRDEDSNQTDQQLHDTLQELVSSFSRELRKSLVRRITFMVVRDGQFPRYFTFKASRTYEEDALLRHIEPAMAYQLEFEALQNFDVKPCFVDNRRVHIYYGVGKKNPTDMRFFIRTIMYPGHILSNVRTLDFLVSEGNRILTDVLDALELLSATYPNTDCSHLFLNIIPTFELDLDEIEASLRSFVDRHGKRLFKLRVTNAEIRFLRQIPGSASVQPIRFVVSSHSGYVMQVQAYQEVRDVTGIKKLVSLSSPPGPLHNQPVSSPYAPKEAIQPKRYKAHLMGTTYIYDFPELFRRQLERSWMRHAATHGVKPPASVMTATELILNAQDELEPTFRPPGSNTCGMIVWEFEMLTPEYPEGRSIIVVANDITYNIGSFGPTEDVVFARASQYARKKGIPRIYISANSGARIGLADEVASRFKVAWTDPASPEKGFDYLYLDEADYEALKREAIVKRQPVPVETERILVDGLARYRLTTIVGLQNGLGVENLQGSGMIAGETSLAYEEIFTLTLVTCRSVGIGAYLVRLGQRVIQVQYTPIILTGASALNKVLGRNVYTSNLQLGGTQIMHRNGVSHLVAENDMEGVGAILRWLEYVPKQRDAPLPVIAPADDIDRPIEVDIPQGAYDPRSLLCGVEDGERGWIGGFFDRDSFTETLAGWAKGVVVGRARLGGIPVGVIAVETRATEHLVWADPAIETSQEQTNVEAGQVWYPNSSFKTAQAIRDFNKGEQLPLIIMANWRGFSGGQGDMYKEILKFGAYIVDALRAYSQPVFVYLVGELRGGAWVVVDPTINSDMMEMYVAENARGGVLEPEGIVEIKFRKPQLLAAIQRLDEPYRALKKELDAAGSSADADARAAVQKKMNAREKLLLPIYHQAAVHFADLHDRPQRMLAKKVVRRIVPWREARSFYYWRLLRRISEMSVVKSIRQAMGADKASFSDARAMLVGWFRESMRRYDGAMLSGVAGSVVDAAQTSASAGGDDDGLRRRAGASGDAASGAHDAQNMDDGRDIDMVRWIHQSRHDIDERISLLVERRRVEEAKKLAKDAPQSILAAFLGIAGELDAEAKRKVLEALGN